MFSGILSKLPSIPRLTASLNPHSFVQIAGLKSGHLPKNYDWIEYPERNKLRVLEKVPQYPHTVRPFKMQKRIRYMRGPEEVHNTLQHEQFGIVALTGGRMKHGHFEMARLTISRWLPPGAFAIWRVDAPWQPCSKKPLGVRMGGGKSSIHHYVTPIKAGRIILEVGGPVEYFQVKDRMEEVAHKLPFKARAVTYEMMQRQRELKEWKEKNNQNYWTYKYIVQNDMLGCSQWICPTDRLWFGEHQ